MKLEDGTLHPDDDVSIRVPESGVELGYHCMRARRRCATGRGLGLLGYAALCGCDIFAIERLEIAGSKALGYDRVCIITGFRLTRL